MIDTKQNWDLLGRTKALHVTLLKWLAVALTTTGSAWPSQARSMRADYDT